MSRSAKTLLAVLPGHIWKGQHVAIEAIGSLADFCSSASLWESCGESVAVVQPVLSEFDRGKKDYRIAAIDAARRCWLTPEKPFGHVRETYQMCHRWCGKLGLMQMLLMLGTKRESRKAIVQSSDSVPAIFNHRGGGREKLEEHVLNLLCVFEELMQNDWDIRLTVLQAIEKLSERFSKHELNLETPWSALSID
ncbi:hypothetical protein FGB62_169g14 [Gracilaria domingensis]|nr:hypothetical protein FGB62_169g14 [Gracilaria domingensis]